MCTKGDHVSLENDTLAISLAHKELFIFGFASLVAWEIQNGLTILNFATQFQSLHRFAWLGRALGTTYKECQN